MHCFDSSAFTVRRGRWRRLVAALLAAGTLTAALAGTASAATPATTQTGAEAVTFWNGVAVNVIVVDGGKANAEAFLWYGFTQAAVYNAVNGITGRYEPYRWNPAHPANANPKAAAAAAAYTVLMHYFPASQPRLDAAYTEALGQVADGSARQRGVDFGERAAARIIALRENDGRGANTPFTTPPAPGVWRPTPTTFTPFFDPWLAQVKPLMLNSTSQFRPAGPPELDSAKYTADYREVKRLGGINSTARTPEQTATARFFSDIAVGPFQGALRDHVARHPSMDISKAARLFAAVDMSLADATGVVWDSKYRFAFWRPITAIELAETDGNPNTSVEAGWAPLITTPPYPDYTSGVNAAIGAGTRALARVIGTERIDLNITSAAAAETRHYEWLDPINRDAIDARVWGGVHFRTADVVGNAQGQKVARWALDRYFQPVS
jgi:hypothetical protein